MLLNDLFNPKEVSLSVSAVSNTFQGLWKEVIGQEIGTKREQVPYASSTLGIPTLVVS